MKTILLQSAAASAVFCALVVTLAMATSAVAYAGNAERAQNISMGKGACERLAAVSVPASAIGLPTNGATVDGAAWQSASAGQPRFCKVTGRIFAADRNDPPIRFELNLPDVWNGKAVQMGGAGLNGFVVDGLGPVPGQYASDPTALAQGYVTFGSDSGHEGRGFDSSFAVDAQALANYSGEAVKRLHDAAIPLVRAYYGRVPRRTYYVGGSKGGQEGLIAAQRYGDDYDGVVSFYPAAQNQSLVTAWYNMWTAAYGQKGAALSSARQRLLHDAVMNSCDGLDGARDGIVADPQACRSRFAINKLRCPGGADLGDDCLSDVQIDALQVAATPFRFPFPLAHGVTQVGPFPVYDGADMARLLYAPDGLDGNSAVYHAFFSQVWPYFVIGKTGDDPDRYNLRDHQDRVQQISALFDASDPNIDQFIAHGGKLIIVQGTVDMLVPETMTTAYVDQLRRRYGAGTRSFLRYFVQPGYGHAVGAFLLKWNSLAALDSWVEQRQPPAHPVAIDANPATGGRSMPLCEQPAHPQYTGTGSIQDARNFICVGS